MSEDPLKVTSKVLGVYDILVASIKRTGPNTCQVRAFSVPQPNDHTTSLFFEMKWGSREKGRIPQIGERLHITIQESAYGDPV